jgi:uncharacterized protein YjiS (DUF1127 family)
MFGLGRDVISARPSAAHAAARNAWLVCRHYGYFPSGAQPISALSETCPPDGQDEKGAEMSAVEMSHSRAAAGGLGQVFARVTAMVAAWNDARITRRELHRLTDRELTDIGLTRGDIERVARGL